jgi:regulatory protein spx
MIKIYTVASCSSCKKAMDWMDKHELPYQEINLITDTITKEDLLEILALTEHGTVDIISRRSQAYQRLNIDFETIKLNELVQIIEENRTLLRRPLVVDEKRLQVGYNDDEIRKFLPRPRRKIEIETAKKRVLDLEWQTPSDNHEISS